MNIGDHVFILDIDWTFDRFRVVSAVIDDITIQQSIFHPVPKFHCKSDNRIYDCNEDDVFLTYEDAEISAKQKFKQAEIFSFRRKF